MSIFDKFRAPDSEEDKEYFNPGEVFGEYKILKVVSYNIIGVLYEAEQRVSLRTVSILVMPTKTSVDARYGERFRNLVKRMQDISHPGILKLLDGAIINRRYVLVYEPLEEHTVVLEQYPQELAAGNIQSSEHPFTLRGQQEADAKKRGEVLPPASAESDDDAPESQPTTSRFPFFRTRNPLGIGSRSRNLAVPYRRAAPLVRQVLEILKFIHSEGLDHLSLTPSSILYMPNGSIKLFGVGLTHSLEKELFERIVSAGIVPIQIGPRKITLNTIDMFSPEIRAGQAYRANSDIYAMGVLCYWLLTGKKPSMGKYQSPREFAPDLPNEWDLFLYKSLDTDPKARYPTVASQLSEFINLNQPDKKRGGGLSSKLERIPVPERIRERGETVALIWRLSIIGFVGVVLVGLLAWIVPSVLIEDSEAERRVAYRALVDGVPNLTMRFQPERVRLEFGDGSTKFIILDGAIDLNIKRGNHKVRISAPNHFQREFELEIRGDPIGPIDVSLIPQWGKLEVRGNPNTRIRATNEAGQVTEVGVIPGSGVLVVNEGVFAGIYQIEAALPDYESIILDDIELPFNEPVSLEVPLDPLPGKLEVVSVPPGAPIFMDGEWMGVTPLSLEGLPVNQDVRFRVAKEGYRELEQTLSLRPNADIVLDFGSLIMKTGEIRPEVKLNGNELTPEEFSNLAFSVDGVIFPGDSQVIGPVAEGTHELVIEHPDYFASRVTLRVGDGRFTPVKVNLLPKPGQVSIRLDAGLPFQFVANGKALPPIDGAGTTFSLDSGTVFDLEVRIRDHLTVRRKISMEPNEQTVWVVTPEKIPAPAFSNDYLVPYVGLELIPVAPGSFMMGSPPEETARLPVEGPQTRMTISYSFWIGRYETTQKAYMEIMGDNPSAFQNPDHPVEQVDWNTANDFCKKLTAIEHKAGRIPDGYVYRLPTEAEWEFAARAGSESPFHWGSTANPDLGNFKGVYPRDFNRDQDISSIYGTVPVGSYEPNSLGLYDVHGNVEEWTNDYWNARLPGGNQTDYFGPSRHPQRAIRGGGWEDSAQRSRAADRVAMRPDTISDGLGFRIVLAPEILTP